MLLKKNYRSLSELLLIIIKILKIYQRIKRVLKFQDKLKLIDLINFIIKLKN